MLLYRGGGTSFKIHSVPEKVPASWPRPSWRQTPPKLPGARGLAFLRAKKRCLFRCSLKVFGSQKRLDHSRNFPQVSSSPGTGVSDDPLVPESHVRVLGKVFHSWRPPLVIEVGYSSLLHETAVPFPSDRRVDVPDHGNEVEDRRSTASCTAAARVEDRCTQVVRPQVGVSSFILAATPVNFLSIWSESIVPFSSRIELLNSY